MFWIAKHTHIGCWRRLGFGVVVLLSAFFVASCGSGITGSDQTNLPALSCPNQMVGSRYKMCAKLGRGNTAVSPKGAALVSPGFDPTVVTSGVTYQLSAGGLSVGN